MPRKLISVRWYINGRYDGSEEFDCLSEFEAMYPHVRYVNGERPRIYAETGSNYVVARVYPHL
jgi:hypothetical protein